MVHSDVTVKMMIFLMSIKTNKAIRNEGWQTTEGVKTILKVSVPLGFLSRIRFMSYPFSPFQPMYLETVAVSLGVVTQISLPINCSWRVVMQINNLQLAGWDLFDYIYFFYYCPRVMHWRASYCVCSSSSCSLVTLGLLHIVLNNTFSVAF